MHVRHDALRQGQGGFAVDADHSELSLCSEVCRRADAAKAGGVDDTGNIRPGCLYEFVQLVPARFFRKVEGDDAGLRRKAGCYFFQTVAAPGQKPDFV